MSPFPWTTSSLLRERTSAGMQCYEDKSVRNRNPLRGGTHPYLRIIIIMYRVEEQTTKRRHSVLSCISIWDPTKPPTRGNMKSVAFSVDYTTGSDRNDSYQACVRPWLTTQSDWVAQWFVLYGINKQKNSGVQISPSTIDRRGTLCSICSAPVCIPTCSVIYIGSIYRLWSVHMCSHFFVCSIYSLHVQMFSQYFCMCS